MRSLFVRLSTLVVVATAISCADAPTAVQSQPAVGESSELLGLIGTILGQPKDVQVLQRTTPLASAIGASRTVGFFGGTVALPEAGISVYVPVGAVLKSTTISVKAPAGSAVAYEFGPHGTRFLVPLIVTQDLRRTAAEGTRGEGLFAAYFEGSLSDIGLNTVIAPVTEILNLVLVGDGKMRFSVGHFSGYLIATGFHDRGSQDTGSAW